MAAKRTLHGAGIGAKPCFSVTLHCNRGSAIRTCRGVTGPVIGKENSLCRTAIGGSCRFFSVCALGKLPQRQSLPMRQQKAKWDYSHECHKPQHDAAAGRKLGRNAKQL